MNQIPKDSSDRHHMAFFGSHLIPCTHPYTQHNIGSRRTKVKQRTNHRSVQLLIHILTTGVTLEMTLGLYTRELGLCIIHLEPLERVLDIFSLRDEGSSPQLLDLKAKEETQLSITDISKRSVMSFKNSTLKASLDEPKIISSTYSWHKKISPLTLLVKRVESI